MDRWTTVFAALKQSFSVLINRCSLDIFFHQQTNDSPGRSMPNSNFWMIFTKSSHPFDYLSAILSAISGHSMRASIILSSTDFSWGISWGIYPRRLAFFLLNPCEFLIDIIKTASKPKKTTRVRSLVLHSR